MKNKILLDRNDVLKIDEANMIAHLNDEIIHDLSNIELVCDQAEGAVRHLYPVKSSIKWSQRNGVDQTIKEMESRIRCALSEFVGMEDALRQNCKNGNVFRINDSNDPIMHFIRELRNMQIHIKNGRLEKETKRYVFLANSGNLNDNSFYLDIYILIVDINDFYKLNNYKKYDKGTIEMMIDEFNFNYQV